MGGATIIRFLMKHSESLQIRCKPMLSRVPVPLPAVSVSFCTHVPHVQENIFTQIEEETKQNVLNNRQKDIPVQNLINPFDEDKQQCILCKLDIHPDYKNVRLLSQFVSPYTGKIYGRHITGLCKQKQKKVEEEIVKAQNCGIMGTMVKDVKFLKDSKLFDPEKPIRMHRF